MINSARKNPDGQVLFRGQCKDFISSWDHPKIYSIFQVPNVSYLIGGVLGMIARILSRFTLRMLKEVVHFQFQRIRHSSVQLHSRTWLKRHSNLHSIESNLFGVKEEYSEGASRSRSHVTLTIIAIAILLSNCFLLVFFDICSSLKLDCGHLTQTQARHFHQTLTWMTWRRRILIELSCKTRYLSRTKSRVHDERSGPTRCGKSEQHSRSRALRQAWTNQSLWLTNIVREDADTDAVRHVSRKMRERGFGKDTPKRAPKRKQRRRSCGFVCGKSSSDGRRCPRRSNKSWKWWIEIRYCWHSIRDQEDFELTTCIHEDR